MRKAGCGCRYGENSTMSEMYTLPDTSTASPTGMLSCVLVAPPAIVDMVCVPACTCRTALFCLSLMYTFPCASTATAVGPLSCATLAGPPSPVDPAAPVPASVTMVPCTEVQVVHEAVRSCEE